MRVELSVGDDLDVGFTSALWDAGFALETRRLAKVGTPVRGHALLPGAQSGGSARVAFEGQVSAVVPGDPTTVRPPLLEVTFGDAIDPRWTSFVFRLTGVPESTAPRPAATDSQLVAPPAPGPVDDPRTARSSTIRRAVRAGGRRESRKFPRFDCKLEARYEFFVGPVAERNHLGEILDVSRGGCRLSTGERKEAPFSRAFVHLKLPVGDKVRMLAVVRWSVAPAEGRPGSMGVQFESGQTLSPAYEQYLAQLEVAEAERLAREAPPPEPIPPPVVPPVRRQATIGLREVAEVARAAQQARTGTPPPPTRRDETFPMWRGPGGRIMTPDPASAPLEPPLPAAPRTTPAPPPPARTTPPPSAPPRATAPPAERTRTAPPPAAPGGDAEAKVADLLSEYLASPEPPPAPTTAPPDPAPAPPDEAFASMLRDYVVEEPAAAQQVPSPPPEPPASPAPAARPANVDFLLYDYLTDDPAKKKKT